MCLLEMCQKITNKKNYQPNLTLTKRPRFIACYHFLINPDDVGINEKPLVDALPIQISANLNWKDSV